MFLILSEIHLDQKYVMDKLDILFEGFNTDCNPLPIFIFIGNFTSKPFCNNPDTVQQYIGCFNELSLLIQKYSNICKNARFVFIPGPNDPGSSSGLIYPQSPLPATFSKSLRKHVPHVAFATNPCRIRYFTKEFLFFRNDVVASLRQHCLISPRSMYHDENTNNYNMREQYISHAMQTMLDQGHLLPLPLTSNPIYWSYDHAMRMYPIPDALILGDTSANKQYYENCNGCDVVVPGLFSKEFNFIVYKPVVEDVETGQFKSDVEFSQID